MSYILFIHVLFGTVAVAMGCSALLVPKGKKWHRLSGRIYMWSMIIMSIFGGIAAIVTAQAINVFAALLTLYLVVTAYRALRVPQLKRGAEEYINFIFIFVVALCALFFGADAMSSEAGSKQGYSFEAYLFIGGICALCASGDLFGLIKGKIQGKQKLARHIWRMCFSYFIAAGSLFTGPGATAFPDFIRDAGILSVPEPLILLVLIYWVVRTLRTGNAALPTRR